MAHVSTLCRGCFTRPPPDFASEASPTPFCAPTRAILKPDLSTCHGFLLPSPLHAPLARLSRTHTPRSRARTGGVRSIGRCCTIAPRAPGRAALTFASGPASWHAGANDSGGASLAPAEVLLRDGTGRATGAMRAARPDGGSGPAARARAANVKCAGRATRKVGSGRHSGVRLAAAAFERSCRALVPGLAVPVRCARCRARERQRKARPLYTGTIWKPARTILKPHLLVGAPTQALHKNFC